MSATPAVPLGSAVMMGLVCPGNENSKWKVTEAGDIVANGALPRKLPWKNSTPRVYARRVKANCVSVEAPH
ncbi:hypothetical protein Ddye_009740 [Dipteronia dyeriana]|uniref:Uncharacterized protein n=1 Tax=Dipteronia dyeriana TaxID=168575 RepID=A0AAD9XC87_9ROSI|nr:hypothetical protein Ddye_009740 [Dipteronia dyeriana]